MVEQIRYTKKQFRVDVTTMVNVVNVGPNGVELFGEPNGGSALLLHHVMYSLANVHFEGRLKVN